MSHLLSPAQLIDNLLKDALPQYRQQVLFRALRANRRILRHLEIEKLALVEQGWADYWNLRYHYTSTTLAEIERALATC